MDRPVQMMNVAAAPDRPLRIELAREAAFDIGDIRVEPAHLRLARGAVVVTLEARVMQVLVALGQAGGAVVSRDELVDRCWDGRIVADNAIQRVISRLRALSAEIGGFSIETVTKVGYLIRPSAMPLASDRDPSRRWVLAGAAGALGVAGGGLFLAMRPKPPVEPAARKLITMGRDAMADGERAAVRQAVAYLEEATHLAPASAEAWSALALAHEHMLDASLGAEARSHAARARMAAGRALAIDANNRDAALALALITPHFRRWTASERQLRQLQAGQPRHIGTERALGSLLLSTGRFAAASASLQRAVAIRPFDSNLHARLGWAQLFAGRAEDADRISAAALARWPLNWQVWMLRFMFLALSGRQLEAHALVVNPSQHPTKSGDTPALPAEALSAAALALADPMPRAAARAAGLVQAARPALGSGSAALLLAALGQADAGLALLEGYFLGDGTRPAPEPLERRYSACLLAAAGAPFWRYPRFAVLVDRIGLIAHWRETRTRPDLWRDFPPALHLLLPD